MANDWKDRLGVVYSTDPDFTYQKEERSEEETLPPAKQKLTVSLDRKKRKGKTVTLIEGFTGKEDDLKDLARQLKVKCGVGGTAKNGEIIIQGELAGKVKKVLQTLGYPMK